VERKEKTFCSNPLRSINGGQLSPIPKGFLSKMADLNIRKHNSSPSQQSPQPISTKFTTLSPSQLAMQQQSQKTTTTSQHH